LPLGVTAILWQNIQNHVTIGLDHRIPMTKQKTKKQKTKAKSSRKKQTESTSIPPTETPTLNFQFHVLIWKDFEWYSTGRNWRAEYQKRLETGITDPFINPNTKCYYTIAAQNYREKFLVIVKKQNV
jgi:hypothetical protein